MIEGTFASNVLLDSQESPANFYNQKIARFSVDSYDRVCNIFTTLLAGSEFFFQEGDGLDILINQKNLALVLKNCLSFIQKNKPNKEGIVGYLLVKHDDIRAKEEKLGHFSNFEIVTVPSLFLDRDLSRAVALRDFRDESTRASLVRSCHALDEALWHLRKTATQASKLVFQSQKISTREMEGFSSLQEGKKRRQSLLSLAEDTYYFLGQGEAISAVSMSIEPALKHYEACRQDVSFKSGIDPSFLNFEGGSSEISHENSMLFVELSHYRNVCLRPLINDILRVTGLESSWSFRRFGMQTEKEKSESELKYITTLSSLASTVLSLLDNEKIDMKVKAKAQDLLEKFLEGAGEKDNG